LVKKKVILIGNNSMVLFVDNFVNVHLTILYGGVHQLGGTPFRKNYAGIGYTYDETRDAFIHLNLITLGY
jgi:hypothetical protein